MKVILAEKPSVARELAKVFGATTRKDGYIEGKNYTFTWAFGHLVNLANPQAYGFNGWNKANLPMLPERFKLAIRQVKEKDKFVDDPDVVKQLKTIKTLFDEATEIIVATDAGREGELIFRYIYYHLKCKKPFKRLWISSQTDEAIKDGFRNLKPGTDYDTLFYSAQCRSEADWMVGLNATQALSIAAGNHSVLSLGRVQTPTLGMISSRFLENKNFKPEIYFQVLITLAKNNQPFKALSTENYKTREQAQQIADEVKDVASGFPLGGEVTGVEIKPKKEQPPLLHDLSSLQQEANKRKGFTAEETLNIAQSLYESKFITYPRTGSRYIGDDVFASVPGLIKVLIAHPIFGRAAKDLDEKILNKRSVNAKKVTDHHALLITKNLPAHLNPDQQAVYDMIAGRLLEAFNKECLKELSKITIVSGANFAVSGTVILSPGWRAVFNDPEEKEDEETGSILPKVTVGETLPVNEKNVLEKQTKPKPLYNEASLLRGMETAGKEIEDEEYRQAMKETGLGTPATRASIIETLIKREYVFRERKNLVPMDKGLAVFDLVKDKHIAQAELTGLWEKRLEEIRNGASVQEFKAEIRNYTRTITHELLEGGKTINLVTAAPIPKEGDLICPTCGKGIIRFNDKAAGCSEYRTGCKFVIWRNIADKKLTDNQLKTLLQKGKTSVLKGFKSKDGTPFDAALEFKGGKIGFIR